MDVNNAIDHRKYPYWLWWLCSWAAVHPLLLVRPLDHLIEHFRCVGGLYPIINYVSWLSCCLIFRMFDHFDSLDRWLISTYLLFCIAAWYYNIPAPHYSKPTMEGEDTCNSETCVNFATQVECKKRECSSSCKNQRFEMFILSYSIII